MCASQDRQRAEDTQVPSNKENELSAAFFRKNLALFPSTASRHNGLLFFVTNGDPRNTVYTYMTLKRVLRNTIRKEKEENRVTEPLTETPEL
ncbi:hypothetical protein, partial [Escherichia coli]|uniref:hypothetical protein n=1 Tax=Escherichia coli TaxID=562 RepID=UPI001BAFE83E